MTKKSDLDRIKRDVLTNVCGGVIPIRSGRAKYCFSGHTIHVRFCGFDPERPKLYKFGINPNSLTADYELWICGGASRFYLIPSSVVRKMYHDPSAYRDYHHIEIRAVSVDTEIHSAQYATNAKSIDIQEYRNGILIKSENN